MTVTPQEYNSLLNRLMNPNEFIHMVRIPENEPIYTVDLSTRKITAPSFISVVDDHNAEILWFKVDRFFDNIDLYNSTCWIQYINADGESYVYAAPLIVGAEEVGSDHLLIPWAISREVAKKEGEVQFSFQFFKLNGDKRRFQYVLNTLPASSKILPGLHTDPLGFLTEPEQTDPETIGQLEALSNELHRLTESYEKLTKDYVQYWIDI